MAPLSLERWLSQRELLWTQLTSGFAAAQRHAGMGAASQDTKLFVRQGNCDGSTDSDHRSLIKACAQHTTGGTTRPGLPNQAFHLEIARGPAPLNMDLQSYACGPLTQNINMLTQALSPAVIAAAPAPLRTHDTAQLSQHLNQLCIGCMHPHWTSLHAAASCKVVAHWPLPRLACMVLARKPVSGAQLMPITPGDWL